MISRLKLCNNFYKMILTFIGSGDAFGSGGRINTCFHVETPAVSFLIDCGAGTIPGLKKHNIIPDHIDIIMITHFHGDHYGGLPFFLLDAATFHRKKRLTIMSPPGCKDKVIQLLALLYPGAEVLEKLDVEFKEYQSYEEMNMEHLSLQAFPVIHTEATLPHGLRIHIAHKILSYSGDTEWTENLVRLCEDADVFICECNFFKLQIKGHLSYQVLEEKLPLLKCKRIILTHLSTEMLDNLDQFNLTCAYDGMVIEI
jgi:ribonuclease BN (tRNA processing enzyme)